MSWVLLGGGSDRLGGLHKIPSALGVGGLWLESVLVPVSLLGMGCCFLLEVLASFRQSPCGRLGRGARVGQWVPSVHPHNGPGCVVEAGAGARWGAQLGLGLSALGQAALIGAGGLPAGSGGPERRVRRSRHTH